MYNQQSHVFNLKRDEPDTRDLIAQFKRLFFSTNKNIVKPHNLTLSDFVNNNSIIVYS